MPKGTVLSCQGETQGSSPWHPFGQMMPEGETTPKLHPKKGAKNAERKRYKREYSYRNRENG